MKPLQHKFGDWTNSILLVVAFTLPFIPRFNLPFLVILFLLFIFNNQKQHNWKKVSGNWPGILLMLFYVYHLVGLLWSENLGTAALDLQIKLPLLIIPLTLFYGYQIERSIRFKIYSYFIYGLEAAVYFCLIKACYFYFQDGSNHFLYKDFSYFIHPGYFSMYLCLATVIVLQRVLANNHMVNFVAAVHWYRLFLFSAAIVLLSSKAGIFVQLLILVGSVIISARNWRRNNFKNFTIPATLAVLVLYFGFFSPLTSARMSEMQQTISQPEAAEIHSSAMRLQAWQSAWEVILEHPLSGAGTGDAKNVLMEKYSAKGFTEIYERKLNAHNQFLQTAVALGIPGLLLLVSLFLSGFCRSFRTKNWLLLSFLIITGLNFMVEAVLEVTAGTLYFALFYVLLMGDEYD